MIEGTTAGSANSVTGVGISLSPAGLSPGWN